MELLGKIKSITVDYDTRETVLTLSTKTKIQVIEDEYLKLKDNELDISINKQRKKKSSDANKLFWGCMNDIARETGQSNWDTYLQTLRKYGQFTYVCVHPRAVESVKKQWRETEEIGQININGKEAVQLLCYFGISTYDSKEFSKLLDCVVQDMKDLGLHIPTKKEIDAAILKLEEQENVTKQ